MTDEPVISFGTDTTPMVTDKTLGYEVSAPFTTRTTNDFPNVPQEGPVVSTLTGQEVAITNAQLEAGEVRDDAQ